MENFIRISSHSPCNKFPQLSKLVPLLCLLWKANVPQCRRCARGWFEHSMNFTLAFVWFRVRSPNEPTVAPCGWTEPRGNKPHARTHTAQTSRACRVPCVVCVQGATHLVLITLSDFGQLSLHHITVTQAVPLPTSTSTSTRKMFLKVKCCAFCGICVCLSHATCVKLCHCLIRLLFLFFVCLCKLLECCVLTPLFHWPCGFCQVVIYFIFNLKNYDKTHIA